MLLKCKLGGHEWQRVYRSTDSCATQAKCSRCGAVGGELGDRHEWVWVDRDPCVKQQVCQRCGELGEVDEKQHLWEEAYQPGSYEIRTICLRCRATSTRQSAFSKFVNQTEITQTLMVMVAAARRRQEPLHHLLLCGQPGMGKTSLAMIIAADMGVSVETFIGSKAASERDLTECLTNLRFGDILLVKQIELMPTQILDFLIRAMEEYRLSIAVGKGSSARKLDLTLPGFTMIGTTSRPFQHAERVGALAYAFNLAPYDTADIQTIVSQKASQLGIVIEQDASYLLAERSSGCPGEALRALEQVYDYATVYSDRQITSAIVYQALALFGARWNPPAVERLPIPDAVKMYVWQRDGGHCVRCGSQENLEYDHIIPVSKGGSNTARNIQLLCSSCNRAKGANIV